MHSKFIVLSIKHLKISQLFSINSKVCETKLRLLSMAIGNNTLRLTYPDDYYYGNFNFIFVITKSETM